MILRTTLKTSLMTPIFLLMMVSAPATGKVVYVDADAGGANNGSSWTDAYNHLQDALADANSSEKPVEIRVAQGVYRPDEDTLHPDGSGDREATFQLISGVSLKGGYAGFGEPDPCATDIVLYETILSGDLLGNDADVNDAADLEEEPSRADNSWHVVTGSGTDETAALDGFTITAGDMAAPVLRPGAGMYNESGSPSVANCLFHANLAFLGGGIYNIYSNPTLVNCTFSDNLAVWQGGGMCNDNSSPTVTNCTFTGNVARDWGGGMSNAWYSAPLLANCTFENNRSEQGGAMSNSIDCKPRLTNCTFNDNHATTIFANGGGILNRSSSAILTACSFTANSAAERGGAISSILGSSLTLTECTFSRNEAGREGGAIHNSRTNLRLSNCTFTQNCISPQEGEIIWWGKGGGGIYNGHETRATLTHCTFIQNAAPSGGGMCNDWGSGLTLTHCSFVDNLAADKGGAICNNSNGLTLINCTITGNQARYIGGGIPNLGGSATLTHCICWGNSGPEILEEGSAVITYSDISGGWPGQGNIDADPCFADPGYWDANGTPDDANDDLWVNGDYHLKSQAGRWNPLSGSWVYDDVTSPCIDAGNPTAPIGPEPFPNGGIINMGAYGGTAEASKSYFGKPVCETIIAGDINGDCKVGCVDFAILASHWLQSGTDFVNAAPTVIITEPASGAVFSVYDPETAISIRADASDADGSVVEVEFIIKYTAPHRLRRTGRTDRDGSDGWQIEWFWWDQEHPYPEGDFTITAYATDDEGAVGVSPEVVITVHGPN